jgi:hypothetical protein
MQADASAPGRASCLLQCRCGVFLDVCSDKMAVLLCLIGLPPTSCKSEQTVEEREQAHHHCGVFLNIFTDRMSVFLCLIGRPTGHKSAVTV